MTWIECAWAWITDHATVISVVVSAIAAVIVARFTVVLARVTGKQARLTKESVELTKESLVTTERAFVYLEGFDVDLGQDPNPGNPLYVTRFRINPKWRNNGNTPSKNIHIQINWSDLISTIHIGVYDGEPIPLFLGPKAVERSGFIEIPSGLANEVIKGGSGRGESNIFIWGRADYEDIFRGTKPHFTQWCYRVHFSAPDGRNLRADFMQWGDYNRSDEDNRS